MSRCSKLLAFNDWWVAMTEEWITPLREEARGRVGIFRQAYNPMRRSYIALQILGGFLTIPR